MQGFCPLVFPGLFVAFISVYGRSPALAAAPQPEAVKAFCRTLIDSGIPAYLRKPRGRDIYAACGQLKRMMEG